MDIYDLEQKSHTAAQVVLLTWTPPMLLQSFVILPLSWFTNVQVNSN